MSDEEKTSTDEISGKEQFARLICGTSAAFLANKLVVVIFDQVKANRKLKELTGK
jgi:hypothetical protein